MKQISDVGVSFRDETTYSINWNFDGARYHIWPNGTYGQNNSPILYKRPPHGIKRNEPGFFDTRRLDGTNSRNMVMIAQVMAIVNAGNMIEIARAARNAEQDRANRDNAENVRLLELAKATFRGIEEHAKFLGHKTHSGSYTLNREQMRALIAYRDHHE